MFGSAAFDQAPRVMAVNVRPPHDPLRGEGDAGMGVEGADCSEEGALGPSDRGGWLATVGRKHWDRLTADERREVFDLLRKSKGAEVQPQQNGAGPRRDAAQQGPRRAARIAGPPSLSAEPSRLLGPQALEALGGTASHHPLARRPKPKAHKRLRGGRGASPSMRVGRLGETRH